MKKRAPRAQNVRIDGFLISTDTQRIDLDVVHGFLTECYWAKGISKETVARSVKHSLCFGVYKAGKQVGFARVISDFATYAYIGDVFVLKKYRGHGLAKRLMQCIMAHPDLQGMRRWSLVTRDAHGLYSRFGFTALKSPERHMEIHNPNVYKGSVDDCSEGSNQRLKPVRG
jgi:N-acetylglutamate synthase-like GNAT family acetyltransferase